jgi:hypothetical protein
MSLGSKECGTLKTSLISVKTELEAMGNAHAEVAAGMRRELEEAVNTFSASMKERRKLVLSDEIHANWRFKQVLTNWDGQNKFRNINFKRSPKFENV